MGCALSSAEKEAVQRSLAIDKTLATENATKQNEIKLLLLGEPVNQCTIAMSIARCNYFRQLVFYECASVCV